MTRSMRDKEDSADYRYLPEPDLPLLKLSEELLVQERDNLPELPASRRRRLQASLWCSSQGLVQPRLVCFD